MAPLIIEVDDLRDGYVQVVEEVVRCGSLVSPRGVKTLEVIDATVVLHNPLDALPIGVGRGVNLGIAAAEAVQLIGGREAPKLLLAASDNFRRFLEPRGAFFWGAYGARIGRQLQHVERKLKKDPDSRQAVITLWDPPLDNDAGHPDYPCTVMLHFIIRHDRLQLHTTMRSNDVWWGLAYDAFQFTQLQLTLANALGVLAGEYHHHATSLHLYERDTEAIENLHAYDDHISRPVLRGFGDRGGPVGPWMTRARWAMDGALDYDSASPTEKWYIDKLRPLIRA